MAIAFPGLALSCTFTTVMVCIAMRSFQWKNEPAFQRLSLSCSPILSHFFIHYLSLYSFLISDLSGSRSCCQYCQHGSRPSSSTNAPRDTQSPRCRKNCFRLERQTVDGSGTLTGLYWDSKKQVTAEPSQFFDAPKGWMLHIVSFFPLS
jgi:hypothetical protein